MPPTSAKMMAVAFCQKRAGKSRAAARVRRGRFMSIDGAAKERVADALGKLLAVEGMAIVTTPRMFGILMRAGCPDDGHEAGAVSGGVFGEPGGQVGGETAK